LGIFLNLSRFSFVRTPTDALAEGIQEILHKMSKIASFSKTSSNSWQSPEIRNTS